MTDRIHHVLESIVVFGAMITTAASNLLLASSGPEAANEDLRIFLLPLIGGVLVSGGLIMLNPQPETRRITIGRGFFAIFVCILAPQILALIHPAIKEVGVKPVMLVAVGGIFSGLAYVLSRPVAKQLYARSERIAARELDKLEGKYSPEVKQPPQA